MRLVRLKPDPPTANLANTHKSPEYMLDFVPLNMPVALTSHTEFPLFERTADLYVHMQISAPGLPAKSLTAFGFQ